MIKDSKITDKFAINSVFDSVAVSKTDGEYQLGFFKGKNSVKNIAINAVDSIVFYRPVFATDSSSSSESEDTPVINGKITDARDGNVYKVAEIGDQTWMAENLRYLPGVDGIDTSSTDPKYYVYKYTGSSIAEAKTSSYYQKHAALYNWPAALEACPAGWHLPTDAEWSVLEDYSGGRSNQYGFGALPGNYFYGSRFSNESIIGFWWSATADDPSFAYGRNLYYNYDNIYRNYNVKSQGFAVRCLKD
ncbi:MAG: hypothetical protein GX801_05830 [Fibrobacter sp.]|nr:hypothetical protein [Fibrobacter sp.]